MELKQNTHFVAKWDNIREALTEAEYVMFNNLAEKIKEHKNHMYYICNIDESYAEEVLNVIKNGEDNKPVMSIEIDEYEDLKADSLMLRALRSAGVDNWDGYDFAIDILDQWESEN